MRCPRPACNSPDVCTRATRDADTPTVPIALRGLNITRRKRVCLDCGWTFFTIEMLEIDFDELRKPPGRLETPNIRLRPGGRV